MMKGRFLFLLILAGAGMMLSWFYAWNSFIMSYLSGTPIPVREAALALGTALLMTSIIRVRRWRWISVLLLYLAGFLFTLSLILYSSYGFSGSFWSHVWISEFLYHEKTLKEWTIIVHSVLWTVFLWIYGIRLIRIPINNRSVGTRVDLGLSAFFLLLLIKLLIRYKGGTIVYDHSITLTFMAFIVFALFSMGLVRNRGGDNTGEIRYFSDIGAILSFTFFVVLFGGGIVMLFLPGLIAGAEFSYELLRTVSKPVGNILVVLLRFIFLRGCRGSLNESPQSGSGSGQALLAGEAEDPGLIDIILVWFLIGVTVLTFLAMIGLLAPPLFRWFISKIRLLVKWLLSRTPEAYTGTSPWNLFVRSFYIVRALTILLIEKIMQYIKNPKDSEYYYLGLLRWGFRSGLPHQTWETPGEYASRLARRFPSIRMEIGLIVEMYNHFLYGGVIPDRDGLAIVRRAWTRLRNPLFWPVRLKTRLLSPVSGN